MPDTKEKMLSLNRIQLWADKTLDPSTQENKQL